MEIEFIIYDRNGSVIKDKLLNGQSALLWICNNVIIPNRDRSYTHSTKEDFDYRIEGKHETVNSRVDFPTEYIKIIK